MITQIQEIVLRLVKEKTCTEGELSINTPLSCLLNSITYIQFIIACEDEFNIEIDDEHLDMQHFKTLNDVVVCINNIINK